MHFKYTWHFLFYVSVWSLDCSVRCDAARLKREKKKDIVLRDENVLKAMCKPECVKWDSDTCSLFISAACPFCPICQHCPPAAMRHKQNPQLALTSSGYFWKAQGHDPGHGPAEGNQIGTENLQNSQLCIDNKKQPIKKMNEWMHEAFIKRHLMCSAVHPKRVAIIWGGLSLTTTGITVLCQLSTIYCWDCLVIVCWPFRLQ